MLPQPVDVPGRDDDVQLWVPGPDICQAFVDFPDGPVSRGPDD